ncbi:ribosome biogenesis GTPase A [Clostridia bacterium]|nr:ribosome biogenesis GTPase A [Clostridia bacterium]
MGNDIHWFPGHMTKTRRMIEADMKLVDAVAEIVDSRCPEASHSPLLNELIGVKPRILILGKSDLSDGKINALWKNFYEERGDSVILCDCRSGTGIKNFTPAVKKTLAELLARRKAKGTSGMALRVMITGIPNVGKSSFINRMAAAKRTHTGDTPGVTRGKQWITIDRDIELLDTPGILWHKFEDKDVALKLAYTGAIKDVVLDMTEISAGLAEFLYKHYNENISARFGIEDGDIRNKYDKNLGFMLLGLIAKKRGMMMSGGEADIERAAAALADEFRGGKLGKISLESPKLTANRNANPAE